jgi:hypothetical protein
MTITLGSKIEAIFADSWQKIAENCNFHYHNIGRRSYGCHGEWQGDPGWNHFLRSGLCTATVSRCLFARDGPEVVGSRQQRCRNLPELTGNLGPML